jgi:hypothetical protein
LWGQAAEGEVAGRVHQGPGQLPEGEREASDMETEGLVAAKQDSRWRSCLARGRCRGLTEIILEEGEKINKLQDRERSMSQLESDITEVNTIFKIDWSS